MMWQSLLKLRGLPDDTAFYCGHEYTQANIRFAKTIEPDNKALAARAKRSSRLRAAGKPTIPRRSAQEKAANPFLRADLPEVAQVARPCRQAGLEGVRGNPRAQEPVLMNRADASTAAEVIRLLDLKPHPEGGHFRETFRDAARSVRAAGARGLDRDLFSARARRALALASDRCRRRSGTGMPARRSSSRSRRHRTARRARDAWTRSRRRRTAASGRAGSRLAGGGKLGDWTLVGCTVAPGFDFAQFEVAPKGWEPE